MNNKDKSIIQIHFTDEYALPYIVEEYLLNEHFEVLKTEDIIHNVRYNYEISMDDALIGFRISNSLVTKVSINLN